MNPIPLTNPKGETKLYYCSKCGHYSNDERIAKECCICKQCGKEGNGSSIQTGPYFTCSECLMKLSDKRDLEKIKEAQDVTNSFIGPVFYNGEFYYEQSDATDQVREDYEDSKEPIPDEVWAFASRDIVLSKRSHGSIAEWVIESLLDNHHEDAEVDNPEELYAFLKEWIGKQTLISFEEDCTRKINLKKIINEEDQL